MTTFTATFRMLMLPMTAAILLCFSHPRLGAAESRKVPVWQLTDGVILIETESVDDQHLKSGWWTESAKIPGYSGGGYLRFEKEGLWNAEWLDPIPSHRYSHPSGILEYHVEVPDEGNYAIRVRNHHEQQDGDNDVWVGVNDSRLIKIWDEDVDKWTWDDRDEAYQFQSGVNRIVVAGRSAGFAIDRIAVVKEGTPEDKWMENDAAVSASTEKTVPTQKKELLKETDGVVVVEAEKLADHPHWTEKSQPKGYTGSGYVQWDGPRASGHGNDDYTGDRLHAPETHLVLKLLISDPGAYHIDVRNIHENEDGDNDAWVDVLGRTPEQQWPVKRIGDSHKDGTGFTWADWGQRTFPLRRGENHLFIGGRSPGFGIDRIVLWKAGDEEANERAHDLETQPSEVVSSIDALEPSRTVVIGARAMKGDNFAAFGRDTSMLTVEDGADRATASTDFPGPEGDYRARLVYLAEEDGASDFEVVMGDQPKTFRADKKSSPEFDSEDLGTVSLDLGDKIKVTAEKSGSSHGRWRMITFDPVDPSHSAKE